MKNFLFALLVMVALLLGSNATISAQPTPVAPAAGSGTEADPWQIATLANLYWLTASDGVVPSPNQATRWTKYFIQTANIDATETSGWYSGVGFSPIGTETVKFTGSYNGNYHTIAGLYINRPETYDIGLFGYVGSSGSISNVGLLNVAVTGKENVGGLVGYFNASTGSIANTYVTGHVTAPKDVGGLIGEIYAGVVTNVYSTATVTGNWGAGVLVAATRGNITNAYSTGLVTGSTYAGGLIGWASATIVNSFWDTQTSGKNSSGGSETGKTTAEMKFYLTFTGWDFTPGTGKWKMREYLSPFKSYPYLQGFTYDEPLASPVVNPIPGLAHLYYSGGTGTDDPYDPFRIATLADLQYLSEHPDDWDGKFFIQIANIDASATSGWNNGAGFSPIGNKDHHFNGDYNATGHTIDGLYINRPLQDRVGLFGCYDIQINNYGIRNLGLTNITVNGSEGVGGMVGWSSSGAFSNVYVSGNVTGEQYVGGLVGEILNGHFEHAYAAGTVTGTVRRPGNLSWAIGGLAGENNGSIHNSYSNANVIGYGGVGGLAGKNTNYGTITNTYAAGTVIGSNTDIGGLAGNNSGSIVNSYSRAAVTGGSNNNGGLVGANTGTATNSFWDTESSGQPTSAGGTGKTTAEMKTALTFVGNCWDFQAETGNGTNNYWGINATANNGYPFLSWQEYTNTATYQSAITIANTPSSACGWSISGGVLTASMDVSIHADDIKAALMAGNLIIQASNEIIINAAIAPALTQARTLTLKAGGNISIYPSASIAPSTEFALNTIFWSDADATGGGAVAIDNAASINTKGGHLWIGGGSGSTLWNGLTVGNGWAKSTVGDAVTLTSATVSTAGGGIQIKGESTATTIGSDGISIYGGSIKAGNGNVSLYGIGGQALGAQANCDGIRLGGPIETNLGNITLSGSSTTQDLSEGIRVLSDITSTSGNISLVADIFLMDSTYVFISSHGTLTLKPLSDGCTIGIARGTGTLKLPAVYFRFNFVEGFSGITIGSSTAGNIGIKGVSFINPVTFKDPVTFNANGNLNLEKDIDLNGQTITLGNEITLNEASGRFYGTSGNITTTRNLSNISAVNVAGLGAVITTSANMGATTVTRGHGNESWGGKNSVLRYYDIVPTNNTGLNATMVFNYNDAELNFLAESKLLLFKSTNGGSTYSCEGGTVNTAANTITLAGIAGFSRWMATERMTLTWNGAGSDFNTAANWTPNLTPSALYNLAIPIVAIGPIVNQAPATPAVCNDLDIASGAVLTIAPGKALTVNGTLVNSGGNAGLVVQSTAAGTGSLIHTTASVPGTVERYIPAAAWITGYDGWHFLSSPIADYPIAGNFTVDPATDYDFFAWSEPHNLWINFAGTNSPTFVEVNGSNTFELGHGYLADYKASSTRTFAGTLNTADVSVSGLTITGTTPNNNGWHLLGNPFASAVTWSLDWTKSGIGGVVNIWVEEGQSYTPVSDGGIIPSGNGFMVQVTTAPGSLTIPAALREHSNEAWYKSTDYPVIKLFAHNLDDPSFQESQVRFNPASTTGFDVEHDGRFLAGYAPLFYSVMAGENLMVNSLPEVTAETIIPFTFIKNEGTNFTIEATGIATLQPAATVFLKDKKLGTDHNLSENPVYAFTSTTGDSPARFELHFGSVGINELPAVKPIIAWYCGGILTVKNIEGLATIGIFNIRGQQLQNFQLDGSGLQTVQLNLPAGVYVARIVNDGRVRTLKMVVQ